MREIKKRHKPLRDIIITILILFLIVAIALSMLIQYAYELRPVDVHRENVVGLYAEPKDSLDMIFVGGSCVYRTWSPLQAYNEFGIASYSFAIQGLPAVFIKYMIIEAEKTQSPELYIIDVSSFMKTSNGKDHTMDYLYKISNSFKYSINRYNAINSFIDLHHPELTKEERKEIHLDFIVNHREREKVTEESAALSYEFRNNDIKSPFKGYQFDIKIRPQKLISGILDLHDTVEMQPVTYDLLDDLFDYIKKENLNVLFTCPARKQSEEVRVLYNTIEQYTIDHGFDFFNGMNNYQNIGIDFSKDLIDPFHLNHYGVTKYTSYLGNYLVENYQLPDRRNDENYSDWDIYYEQYIQRIDVLTDEFNAANE